VLALLGLLIKYMDPEEIKKIQEAKDAAEAEVKKTKEDLAKVQEDLKKLQDKDMNFGNLRKSAEEIQKQKDEETKKLKEQIDSLSGKISEMEQGKIKDQEERENGLINAYGGKDEELKKVIKFHFDKLKVTAKTSEEIEEAAKGAYILATGGRADDNVIKSVQGVRGNVRPPVTNSTTISPEVKELADKFNQHGAGIKDEDLKNPKYQVKPGQSAESNYNL